MVAKFLLGGPAYQGLPASEQLNSELEGTKIVKENERWFLILPQSRNIKKPENQRLGVVAFDLGVRTFLSYYSETHHGMRCGCSATVDRDLNGARGILLRALRAPSVSTDSRGAIS